MFSMGGLVLSRRAPYFNVMYNRDLEYDTSIITHTLICSFMFPLPTNFSKAVSLYNLYRNNITAFGA